MRTSSPLVNSGFSPREGEVEAARRVLAAMDAAVAEGRGAIAASAGTMADLANVRQARAVIDRADAIERRREPLYGRRGYAGTGTHLGGRERSALALADYLQPHERVAVECGQVAATNLRLIHHIARSGAPVFRELPYAAVQGIKLTQRPRTTTVVLGALIAALSLLAGPGTPLQLAAGGLGLAAVLLGVIFGDLSLEISTATGGAKPQRWPMREVGRRESETLVTVARAWMDGGYDLTPETALAPLASSALARSVLLLPADDAAQTLAAIGGNADVLCLDLTTLVHPSRRGAARELVPSAIAVAKLAGRRVWVRVNIDDADDAEADLAGSRRGPDSRP